MASWDDCLGQEAMWAKPSLLRTLRYEAPLPVQSTVIPTVARAVLSHIPLDVSLTAPTGSGKTLCYLIPLLRLVTSLKKGLNDVRLRALILVPTRALGQQVHRELQRLAQGSSVTSVCLCEDRSSLRAEGEALLRPVRVYASGGCPSVGGKQQGQKDEEEENEGGEEKEEWGFPRMDVLVATPQRLLRHLEEQTRELRLASLRLLVVDEADQVLAGNFANFVTKVVERYENESYSYAREAQRQQLSLLREGGAAAAVASGILIGVDGEDFVGRPPPPPAPLHKILCSATLTSRTARIAEVRLHNCHYFVLDSSGTDLSGEEGVTVKIGNSNNSAGKKGKAKGKDGAQQQQPVQVVKASFALPPKLQEHVIFVEDHYRHAVLLKLVRELYDRIQTDEGRKSKEDAAQAAAASNAEEKEKDKDDGTAYPPHDRTAGNTILVFCSSAEEARVMGHFLTAAGIPRVVEFTTLATDSERRAALLAHNSSRGGGASSRGGETARCVVASDALMRGIDIPQVGHVVMYHPPANLSQYVHRAGRTARALRSGHVHLLLNKIGGSGTQLDGEVALYKQLSASITRTLPTRYERHFFVFLAKPPAAAAAGSSTDKNKKKDTKKPKANEHPETETKEKEEEEEVDATAVAEEKENKGEGGEEGETTAAAEAEIDTAVAETVEDSAEWWIKEAGRFLQESQAQLERRWASAMENLQRTNTTAPTTVTTKTSNSSAAPQEQQRHHHHQQQQQQSRGARRSGAIHQGRGGRGGGSHDRKRGRSFSSAADGNRNTRSRKE